jgi:thiamine pyrophosphate-dependent acetolactate synthase large subunit-like protein
MVVAGPGIVPDGVEAVRRFARRTGVGVLNTWGAKGLFRWDDPAHRGTIGLQARDVERAGILGAGIVLVVGLDERELPLELLGPKAAVVDPDELEAWADRVEPAPPGDLYDALRAALVPLYDSEVVPLTPAAAVADLAAVLPPGGLVCADAGLVGLWVARTLPTTELGSVYVPPVAGGGLARTRALEAAEAGRAVVYVTQHDLEGPFLVERWSIDGPTTTRTARRAQVREALTAGGSIRMDTPVDLSLTRVLVDVAGPVTAWGGGL